MYDFFFTFLKLNAFKVKIKYFMNKSGELLDDFLTVLVNHLSKNIFKVLLNPPKLPFYAFKITQTSQPYQSNQTLHLNYKKNYF